MEAFVGTISITSDCPRATAPHEVHSSGGGGSTECHAPRYPITSPPQSEHVPILCLIGTLLLPNPSATR